MANKIQLKRGTSAPGTILDVGEPGYDSQNKILYVGNGVGQAATSFNPNSLTGASVSGNKLTFTKENSSNVVVTLPVDEAISSTSTNPVQNKVVQSAISTAITNAAEVSVGSSEPNGQQLVWFDNSGSDTKIKVRANSSSNFEEVAGLSGVYVDSGTMPAGYNVQIDPTGEPVDDFFAPAGYGLGASTRETADLNNETKCGWKAFTSNAANRPFDYGTVMTINRYGLQITQIAFDPYMSGQGQIAIRHRYQDVWKEWEFVNPPMKEGVEYRTTERWNGKVVYAKCVSYTPASQITQSTTPQTFEIPHNISGITNLVRWSGRMNKNGYIMPYVSTSGGLTTLVGFGNSALIFRVVNTAWTDYTFYFDIYYTKD